MLTCYWRHFLTPFDQSIVGYEVFASGATKTSHVGQFVGMVVAGDALRRVPTSAAICLRVWQRTPEGLFQLLFRFRQ
jgi:hypothetical protein